MKSNCNERSAVLRKLRTYCFIFGILLVTLSVNGIVTGEFSMPHPVLVHGYANLDEAPERFSREGPAIFYLSTGCFLALGVALLYIAGHSQLILNSRKRNRNQSMFASLRRDTRDQGHSIEEL